jgi:hypothetical protein
MMLVLAIGSALLGAGCSPGASGGATTGEPVDKRVTELERQVTALQAQNRDVRAKLRAAHSLPTRSPLEGFFASPEFWECTYDSSWTDCSKRCSANTATANAACFDKPEAERVACFDKAAQDGSNCLKNCPVQSSPTNPPSCI